MDYNVSQNMVTEHCFNCGITFAITREFYDKRQADKKSFFCPNGHSQYYTQSTEQKLKRELERKDQELQRQQLRAVKAEGLAEQKARQYSRIRTRIKNGVCPCCNRTFENVARHIATKHPEFGKDQSLPHLRSLYGLTQADLANEIGISTSAVSRFENGKTAGGDYVHRRIENWIAAQTG